MFSYLLLTSIIVTGHSWVLNSTHTNIIPQLTDDVSIHCFYKDASDISQTMYDITRIRLLKLDNKKRWKEYAEIKMLNASLAHVIGSNKPALIASGYLGKVSESYLSVTWSTSSEETVGSYQCEIDGFAMNGGNDVHVTTGMVNLTYTDVTTNELVDLIVQMRKKYERLSQEITFLKEDNLVQHQDLKAVMESQVRNWSQKISQEINSLKEENLVQYQNLTRNIKRQVDSDIVKNYFELRHWPAGRFALFATDDGCPDTLSSKFKSSFTQFQTETSSKPRHNFTSASNLKGEVFKRCGFHNVLKFEFCGADFKEPRALWPAGSYCVGYGGGCPSGFKSGHTNAYPETSRSIIRKSLNSIILFNDEMIQIHHCCRDDGPPEIPILLPNTKPFYLYRYKGRCQEVYGLHVQEQMFTMQTDASKSNKFSNEFHPDGTVNDLTVQLCYYYKK